jgi:hypothetical protein
MQFISSAIPKFVGRIESIVVSSHRGTVVVQNDRACGRENDEKKMSRAKDWSRNTIYTRYILLFGRLRGCFYWKEKDQRNGKIWVLLYFICSLAFAAGTCGDPFRTWNSIC